MSDYAVLMRDVWVVMAANRPGGSELQVSGVFSDNEKAVKHLTAVIGQGRDGHLSRWPVDAPAQAEQQI